MKRLVFVLTLVCIGLEVAAVAQAQDDHYARSIVILALKMPNDLRVGGAEFKTKVNPKGTGVFVYDPRTRFDGVERRLVWLVIKDQAFPLNGPSKALTPSLKWPREAPASLWKQTGLDPYSATEALKLVFGS